MTSRSVSVVMPAHNAAATIRQSIESVLAQSHRDWILWIVDDLSSDDTRAIAQEYADRDARIRLLQNEVRSGVSKTRNRAISASQSDFISFLDSDDIWLPEKLERQLEAMEKTGAIACCSAYEIMESDGRRTGQVRVPPSQISYRQMLAHNRVGCLTFIYSAAKIGKFPMPENARQEDYLTWLAIMRATGEPVLGLPETLACYRVGQVSLSSNKAGSAHHQWFAYRHVLQLNLFMSSFFFAQYASRSLIRLFKESRGHR